MQDNAYRIVGGGVGSSSNAELEKRKIIGL
jgi:hypothetical protein